MFDLCDMNKSKNCPTTFLSTITICAKFNRNLQKILRDEIYGVKDRSPLPIAFIFYTSRRKE